MTQSPCLPDLPKLPDYFEDYMDRSRQEVQAYATAHGLACYEAGSAAAAQAVPEGYALFCCPKHTGQQFTVAVAYAPPLLQICPHCDPDYLTKLAAPTQGAEGAAPQAVVGEAHWTIIAPDGWKLTGDKPITLIVEANKHEREINPAEDKRQHTNLMESIAEEQAEHERDRAELVNRFLRWPLPRTVFTDAGTGTVEPSKRPENWNASGTNLLTADEASAMLAFVLDCDEGDRELAHRSLAALTPSPTPTAPQEADALREALKDALEFIEHYSRAWDGVSAKHPNTIATNARAALAQHQPQQGEQHG